MTKTAQTVSTNDNVATDGVLTTLWKFAERLIAANDSKAAPQIGFVAADEPKHRARTDVIPQGIYHLVPADLLAEQVCGKHEDDLAA